MACFYIYIFFKNISFKFQQIPAYLIFLLQFMGFYDLFYFFIIVTFEIFIYLFILAAPGLSYGMRDLRCGMRDL